jgi:putative redox protein
LIAVQLDGRLIQTGEKAMEMRITFPGGKKVNAELNGIVIPTDQPVEDGGEGTAPSPFGYFLASLGTCAGIYVLSFCQQRGIDTEGMSLTQQMEFGTDENGKKRLSKVTMDILLPPGFPEKYRNAIVKTADLCTVKKVISDPPEFVITANAP